MPSRKLLPSGTIREEMHECYGSPFAVETTHLKFRNSDLSAKSIGRSSRARQYRESFEVYGSKKGVEWPLIEGEPLVVHTAKKPEPEIPEKVECPDFAKLLPEEIAPFTTGGIFKRGWRGTPQFHARRLVTGVRIPISFINS